MPTVLPRAQHVEEREIVDGRVVLVLAFSQGWHGQFGDFRERPQIRGDVRSDGFLIRVDPC